MDNHMKIEKNEDSKKIMTLVILILTVMVGTTGATYAYFAIASPTNNAITGTAATASLVLTNTTTSSTSASPQLIAPTNSSYTSKPMVPQYSYRNSTNVLQKAFNGSGTDKCVDANGNVICRAYTFVIKNMSTAAVNVRGKIQFQYASGTTFTNLRWKLMTSATAVTVSSGTASSTFSTTAPIIASTSAVYFDTQNVLLAANGGSKQYWIIFWIEETGSDQSTSDKGTFNGLITFDVFDASGSSIGGITSTITS